MTYRQAKDVRIGDRVRHKLTGHTIEIIGIDVWPDRIYYRYARYDGEERLESVVGHQYIIDVDDCE